ncbi:MAG: AmmeMemoRadiSam system protein A [Desulfovibrionaceae bacterium]|nr:AmmeMemoRadiSam system protein A [Desulfovibrionaceae bacterium]
MSLESRVSPKCRSWLAGQVVRVITAHLKQEQVELESFDASDFTPTDAALLLAKGSVFVTLKIKQNLRGCIGSIMPYEPLYVNIQRMAYSAAFNDPRFPPLTPAEWPLCSAEISVLSQPTLCPDPSKIEIGRHGLILHYQGRSGVFLPQVPVEQHWA